MSVYSEFDKQHVVDSSTGCWEWQRAKSKGYGLLCVPGVRFMRQAHRVSYERHVGPIPSGLLVRHACDNPGCVNPKHLSLGTNKNKSEDMALRGRGTHVLSDEEVHEARRRYALGEAQKVIAKSLGVTHTTISDVCTGKTRGHIPFLSDEVYIFRKGNLKLSDSDVLSVRRRYAEGEGQASIASSFGMAKSSISRVCSGRTYKHLLERETAA